MTEMIFNEWEKKILDNGGDVLCIAEAFLLAQYSDYAYHKVDACIDKFVELSTTGDCVTQQAGYTGRSSWLAGRRKHKWVCSLITPTVSCRRDPMYITESRTTLVGIATTVDHRNEHGEVGRASVHHGE